MRHVLALVLVGTVGCHHLAGLDELAPTGRTSADGGWVRTFGATGDQRITALAVDRDDALVVAGTFRGALDFGDGPLVAANHDLFVAKLDPDGTARWAHRFGAPDSLVVSAVALDTSGDVVLTGHFAGRLEVGSEVLDANEGGADVFVLRLDVSGAPRWARRAGGPAHQAAWGLSLDADGNPLVAGSFDQTIAFEAPSAPPEKPHHTGKDQMMLWKLDRFGKHLWSAAYGDDAPQRAQRVLEDGTGIVASRRASRRARRLALAGLVVYLVPSRATAEDCSAIHAQIAEGVKKYARPPYDCRGCAEQATTLRAKLTQAGAAGTQSGAWSSTTDGMRKEWEAARASATCAVQAFEQEVAACNAGRVGPFKVCGPSGGGEASGKEPGRVGGGSRPSSELDALLAQLAAQQKAAAERITKAGAGADRTSYGGTGAGKGGEVAKSVVRDDLDDAGSTPTTDGDRPGLDRPRDALEGSRTPDGFPSCSADSYACGGSECCRLPEAVPENGMLPELVFPGPEAIPSGPEAAAKAAHDDMIDRKERRRAEHSQADVLGVPLAPQDAPPTSPSASRPGGPSAGGPSPLAAEDEAPAWTAQPAAASPDEEPAEDSPQGGERTSETTKSPPSGPFAKAVDEAEAGRLHAVDHGMEGRLKKGVGLARAAGECADEAFAGTDGCAVKELTPEELGDVAGGLPGAVSATGTGLEGRLARASESLAAARKKVGDTVCGYQRMRCPESSFLHALFGPE